MYKQVLFVRKRTQNKNKSYFSKKKVQREHFIVKVCGRLKRNHYHFIPLAKLNIV